MATLWPYGNKDARPYGNSTTILQYGLLTDYHMTMGMLGHIDNLQPYGSLWPSDNGDTRPYG